MTFSVVARDPGTGELGVAVASKFLAVGSVVPWARHDAGAVATQAYANPTYGPRGLALLREGGDAEDVVEELTGADGGRADRQLGIVDAAGGSATFTGSECLDWAGGVAGDGYACQGNILVGERVVDAMAGAYEAAEGDLASRLLAALRAGDDAGGDRRGKQSAALLVVKERGGYMAREMGWDFDRMIDLRVDDDPDPVPELEHLLATWRLYFTPPSGEAVEVTGRVREEVEEALRTLEHLEASEELTLERYQHALRMENFEERELEGWRIDPHVLAWLREEAARRAR